VNDSFRATQRLQTRGRRVAAYLRRASPCNRLVVRRSAAAGCRAGATQCAAGPRPPARRARRL